MLITIEEDEDEPSIMSRARPRDDPSARTLLEDGASSRRVLHEDFAAATAARQTVPRR